MKVGNGQFERQVAICKRHREERRADSPHEAPRDGLTVDHGHETDGKVPNLEPTYYREVRKLRARGGGKRSLTIQSLLCGNGRHAHRRQNRNEVIAYDAVANLDMCSISMSS